MENPNQSPLALPASSEAENPIQVTPPELKAISLPELLVLANGPKEPLGLAALVEVLRTEALDMDFYPFLHPVETGFLVLGNIQKGTHRFTLRGTEKELHEVIDAIEINLRRFHRAHPVFKSDRIRAYQSKRAARVARLEERADNKERKGRALLGQAKHIQSFIPLGQPILVGHHSERRHRRDLDRIHLKTGQGFAFQDEAETLRRRADAAEQNRAIFSDDPEASEKLGAKVARLKERQRIMVEVNKRIKKGKSLADLGYSLEEEEKLKKGDFAGRVGFPDYAIRNNGANIRRLEQRLKQVEKKETEALPEDQIINGIRIVENGDENRLQVFFPGIPSEDVRERLKRSGFRWSPSNGCWQRHRSNAATYYAKQIAKAAV